LGIEFVASESLARDRSMTVPHGPASFLVGYLICTAGIVVGMIVARARLWRLLLAPLIAIVGLILSALLMGLLSIVMPHLPELLEFVISSAFIFALSFFLGTASAHPLPTASNHKRGTLLEWAPSRPTKGLLKAPGLTLAGQPVQPEDETKHFKLIGTTGTGKSTAMKELLTGALDRGDRAVIADPDGSYVSRFYDKNRGDVILNPFDTRAARWDLFAEIEQLYDADQLARSLIVDTEGTEKSWRNYARVFLTSVLRQLHRVKHHDVAELYQLLATTPVDDLRELLNDTPAGPYLTQDNGKFFGAVRAVANTHLAALEMIAAQRSGEALSVRSWIRRGRGQATPAGVLFLPYRANEIATLRGLISTWMRLAIFETMSAAEGDQRLWFAIDELDALGAIDGLKDALARLRKFGGRCILGFQSIAQVSGSYGHAEAQTIVENCANTVILRCSSSEGGGTARFASRLIGEREIIREHMTKTRQPGNWMATKSQSQQHVMESAVLPSEIEQLPDLQGYLKFASTPEWRRVRFTAPS
jgi:type IV secretory pathway TraG/TraD family ATPase VirD4